LTKDRWNLEQRVLVLVGVYAVITKNRIDIKAGISKFTEEGGILEVYTEEDMRKIDLSGLEKEVEEIVKKDLLVKKYILSRKEAESVVDLRKVPKDIKEIRIVDIEGFDKRPCRDEHADRTGEIGFLKILKVERAGKGRYRFSCGKRRH